MEDGLEDLIFPTRKMEIYEIEFLQIFEVPIGKILGR